MICGKCKECGGDIEDYECHNCQGNRIQTLEADIAALRKTIAGMCRQGEDVIDIHGPPGSQWSS